MRLKGHPGRILWPEFGEEGIEYEWDAGFSELRAFQLLCATDGVGHEIRRATGHDRTFSHLCVVEVAFVAWCDAPRDLVAFKRWVHELARSLSEEQSLLENRFEFNCAVPLTADALGFEKVLNQ